MKTLIFLASAGFVSEGRWCRLLISLSIGASQAMEDGACLAVCLQLSGKEHVADALRAYEKIRYDRVKACQKTGEKSELPIHLITQALLLTMPQLATNGTKPTSTTSRRTQKSSSSSARNGCSTTMQKHMHTRHILKWWHHYVPERGEVVVQSRETPASRRSNVTCFLQMHILTPAHAPINYSTPRSICIGDPLLSSASSSRFFLPIGLKTVRLPFSPYCSICRSTQI